MKVLFAVMSVGLIACGGTDQVAFLLAADSGVPAAGSSGAAAAHAADVDASGAAVSGTSGGEHDAAVGGNGMIPPELGGLSHQSLCAGSSTPSCSASPAFTRALCTCGNSSGPGSLSVESLGAAGLADVGVNGDFGLRIDRRVSPSPTAGELDGDLIVAGTGPAPLSGAAPFVAGNVSVAGDLAFAGNVHVGGDVWSRDFPIGNGVLRIDGDLHQASTQPGGAPNVMIGGKRVTESYAATPPCACDAQHVIDIAGLVTKAATDNDDAAASLDPKQLAPAPSKLALPCGRYYVSAVQAASNLTLTLSGRTALFVHGDFSVSGDLSVELAPGAELDLFVDGSLTIGGAARFGDASRPQASRVYVAGAVTISTVPDRTSLPRPTSALGDTIFVGSLYAPTAALQLASHSDVYGSLFVNDLVVLQSLLVHYSPPAAGSIGASGTSGASCAP